MRWAIDGTHREARFPRALQGRYGHAFRPARLRLRRQEIWHGDPVQDALGSLQQFRHPAIFIRLDINAELRAELAAMHDNALAERLAPGVVDGKGLVDVIMVRERTGQRLRLRTRLGDAKPNVRTRREAASPINTTRPKTRLGEQKS